MGSPRGTLACLIAGAAIALTALSPMASDERWTPIGSVGSGPLLEPGPRLVQSGAGGGRDLGRAVRPYVRADDVSGAVMIAGTPLLQSVLTRLAVKFETLYPDATVRVASMESDAAAADLVEGRMHLAVLSRLMDEEEIAAFEAAFGHKPVPYGVAVDTVAVYVHRDNPLPGLTMDQLDAIFAKTPRSRLKNPTTWGDLLLSGEWASVPIHVYGLLPATGTHRFFRERALNRGDVRKDVKERADSAAVVRAIGQDRYGIGYAGVTAATPEVRIVPLAMDEASPFVEPDYEEIQNRGYPFRRHLFVYLNQTPNLILPGYKPLRPVVREFLRFLYSQEGQAEVVMGGFVRVEDWIINQALQRLR